MQSLNPYDVLGIQQGSSKDVVKKAYKMMLIKTHPDKMNGDAKYFMMVHDAYGAIMKSFSQETNFSHAPKNKKVYEQNSYKPSVPENLKGKFNESKFNTFFNENRIDELNPFSRGYSKYMSGSLQHQEEIDLLKKQNIQVKKRQVVVFKEPEPINELYTGNYSLLGQNKVGDYSCNNGTDYMKAYMEPTQHIDTCKKYKNLNDITSQRSNENFELNNEEKMYMMEKQKKLNNLEQYRMQNMEMSNRNINSKYTTLNNLLN